MLGFLKGSKVNYTMIKIKEYKNVSQLSKLTPVKAIKKYCRYSCCANDLTSWKKCTVKNCPLYNYRLGKRPQKTVESLSYFLKNKTQGDTNDK